jgi:ribosomal protein S18 acetylase RimI-like enzyme
MDLDALAAAFTLVYTDYFTPAQVDAAWARRHVRANDIRLELSPLWLDERGEVVALAMLGVRGERGWIGGFGVAPAYRGQGMSHELTRTTLDIARVVGLRQVQLEVITRNERAIGVYERAGFRRTRDLRIFSARPDVAGQVARADVAATPTDDVNALLDQRARVSTIQPAWQREPASLAADDSLQALVLGTATRPDGYAVFRVGPSALSLTDVAVADADRAADLLGALAHVHPGRGMSLVNEPEESPLSDLLGQLGWDEPLRQHEMVCRFA